jgi:ureidoglycolate lyase
MPDSLRPEPLTPEAFAPFGTVVAPRPDTAREINEGFTTRFHALAEVETTDGAPVILSIFRGRPRPLVLEMLERHPLGAQAFMPLGRRPWLTVCAEAPDAPLRAFLCGPEQGLCLAPGVWHHPLLTLATQDFLVADRARPEENLEEARLPGPVRIAL